MTSIHTRRMMRGVALTLALAVIFITNASTLVAAPASKVDKKPGAAVDDAAPVKPKFGAWGVSKEVRGTDGWYMYAFSHPQTKQVLGMIVTNLAPESVERGDLADRLTFRTPTGGQIRLGGNRGLWMMTASEQGGMRQQMGRLPKFDEHPIDRYQRLWTKDPTLTLKKYIETDEAFKDAVAKHAGGKLPGLAPKPVRGAAGVDAEKPLRPQLDRAVMMGDAAMVRDLIKRGVDINALNDRGDTPLTAAAMYGRASVVEALLDSGAKHDVANKRGEAPLRIASGRDHLRIVGMLLKAGADPDAVDSRKRTALTEAVEYNRITLAAALLKGGASVDKAVDRRGRPILFEAVGDNHLEMVAMLMKAGADVNATDDRGQTPLHVAVEAGHVRMVKALLDAGAKTDVKDRYKQTPFTAAERRQRLEILDVLREHGK